MAAKSKRLAILGAGGHGRVALDAVLCAGGDTVVGFLDDDPAKLGAEILGIPVLGNATDLARQARHHRFDGVVVAIGDNYMRRRKFDEVIRAGLEPANAIHPTASISRFAQIGAGVVIFAGAVVNPGTVVDDNACINTAASVDHDCLLNAHCHIFPKATLTGGVRIGEYAVVGSGAVVNPYLSIGRFSFVGSGAVVVRDVGEGIVVAGVPARLLRPQPLRPEDVVAAEEK